MDDNINFLKYKPFNGLWPDPADYHPTRITKTDKDCAKELDFKDIKFSIKIKDGILMEFAFQFCERNWKANSISISAILKWTSKSSYMSQKNIWQTLKELAYVGMFSFTFWLWLHQNKYGIQHYCYSKLLFTYTDSLMDEIKTKEVYEDYSQDPEIFYVNSCSAESNYGNDSNKLVVGKKKDKTGGAAKFEAFNE